MASKSGKQIRPPGQILSANLSNSAFGFVPASGSKGKSPAVASRGVNVLPDLDLISGFAFLSFASLDQLETHIEHNEAEFASVSVNVGQKRKAEGSIEPHQNTPELNRPANEKKSASTRKIPVKTTAVSSTSDFGVKPKERKLLSKNKTAPVVTISDRTERSLSGEFDFASGESKTLHNSPNTELEISLLCSETVDLGDEEEMMQLEDCRTSTAGKSRDARDGCSAISSNYMNDVGVAEGRTRPDDSKMKKKKKKKRKSEHCDQTSQTKFRIKKKKKPISQVQDLEGSSNMAADFSVGSKPMDTEFQDADSLSCKTGKVDDDTCDKSQTKGMLSRPKLDRPQCARTSIYQVPNKSSYFKSRNSGSGVSSAVNSPVELAQVKNIDKCSLDSLIPNSSDREIDAGDETKSISVLSDFSDHSSDMELFDPHGCFLLNSKIDKVVKEECRGGESSLDVDIETVGKEAKKNFLVVSGIEAGHFSYHPAVTKEGTIDTSIQAYPNEIDIFLQCAKMQEGQLIKIINPDDSLELYSHLTQKGGRDTDTIKATRSATERKRRHHLGDLFQDMKLEVFRDVNEADLYFSKQAILSKAITTLEELKKELSDLTNARVKMLKQNKELKEKRNMLMFGKTTVDVDDNKVAAILRHLNINIEEAHEDYTVKKTAEDKEDAKIQEELSESNVSVVEPSAKGRPRASKSLLTPWLLKPHQTGLQNRSAVNMVGKSDPQCPEKLKAIHTSSPETHSSLEEKASNVSCGVQTQAVESGLSKSPQVENSTLSQMLLRDNEIKSAPLSEATRLANLKHSLAESSPKVIHTVTFTPSQSKPAVKTVIGLPFGVKAQETRIIDSSKPSGSKSSTQSQASLTDDHTMKITPVDKQASHEGPKPSLVKILPKPAIIHLDSLQQKAIMESLGQVKQPSSDKIICNLSRLSTQASPSTPSRICIIRSGQLMKSLDSKNVMHIKITNDVLKSLDTGSISGIPGVSSSTINQPSSGIKTDPSVHSVCNPQNPEVPISAAHVSTMTATQKLLLPATTAQTLLSGVQNPVLTTSTTHVPMVASACNFVLPTSTAQICPVPGVQNPVVLTSTTLTPSMAGAQRPLVLTSTPQIVSVTQVPQKPTDRTLPLSQIPLTTTTTSAPKFIFSREPLNFLPAPGHVQGLPSAHETSSDVTLRALASLNQLQANKPAPPIETVTAQPDSNRNPATGYLIDLKNVVMKVGSVGSATPSTTPLETPMIAGTTSLKGSATNQISEMSLNSVPLKQVATMSSVSTTVLASPVISFPSSVPPAISTPSSVLPGISVPSTKLLNISVPSSTSLNTSFTMSAVTDPVASTGTAISSDVDTIVAPLINPCLESFNFMPEQLAKPTPSLSSERSVLSSSVDTQKQATESASTASHPISLGDMFKPETSSSSTVLTQEMLKIPGIKQSSEVSSMLLNPVDLPLTDVFPDLVEIDTLKNIDSANLEGAPSSVSKKITGGSDTGSVKQASLPTYSLRSSSGDTSKLTSPTKGSVRDSKRGKLSQLKISDIFRFSLSSPESLSFSVFPSFSRVTHFSAESPDFWTTGNS